MMLDLPRFSSAEIACLNRLARRGGVHTVRFMESAWSLRLDACIADSSRPTLIQPYHLTIDFGGCRVVLAVETAVLGEVLRTVDPGADPLDLPEPLLLALSEVAAETLIQDLQTPSGKAVRFIAAGMDCPADAGPYRIAISLHRGNTGIEGVLMLDARGLAALADLVEHLPESHDVAAEWDALPLPLPLEIGWVDLPAVDFAGLAKRDIILMDETTLRDDGRLIVRVHPTAAIRARLDGSILCIEGIARTTMNDDSTTPSAETQAVEGTEPLLDSLDQVEVRLTFDIGQQMLTLAELRKLCPGTCFDLGRDPRRAVNIRANGRLVGTGELLQIDDHIGVRISSLAGAAE